MLSLRKWGTHPNRTRSDMPTTSISLRGVQQAVSLEFAEFGDPVVNSDRVTGTTQTSDSEVEFGRLDEKTTSENTNVGPDNAGKHVLKDEITVGNSSSSSEFVESDRAADV